MGLFEAPARRDKTGATCASQSPNPKSHHSDCRSNCRSNCPGRPSWVRPHGPVHAGAPPMSLKIADIVNEASISHGFFDVSSTILAIRVRNRHPNPPSPTASAAFGPFLASEASCSGCFQQFCWCSQELPTPFVGFQAFGCFGCCPGPGSR